MGGDTDDEQGVPRPGAPVRGSTTGRASMAALDLLGRRWILRVIWELSREPAGFRALQRRCDDMSSSVLDNRLRDLVDARIATRDEAGRYELTPLGTDLVEALDPLLAWSNTWARELGND
ncbi:helix-turn-helix transcriptional regulator (plasmid) [Embleya sp. NBC_00888]|uniref:winged helix-turn-helix transcriptional regulator n=1 Tax=Embleya sp. NBC_00888 TaxID=2975960 RepID=UPI002F919C0B|nr:helix-turn-helix transcriptional regulator [Embleya sp. NBC_00888]